MRSNIFVIYGIFLMTRNLERRKDQCLKEKKRTSFELGGKLNNKRNSGEMKAAEISH